MVERIIDKEIFFQEHESLALIAKRVSSPRNWKNRKCPQIQPVNIATRRFYDMMDERYQQYQDSNYHCFPYASALRLISTVSANHPQGKKEKNIIDTISFKVSGRLMNKYPKTFFVASFEEYMIYFSVFVGMPLQWKICAYIETNIVCVALGGGERTVGSIHFYRG